MANWLMHYAKGETAKNHKWVERKRGPKGWIYKYKEDKVRLDKAKETANSYATKNTINNRIADANANSERALVNNWNAYQAESRENVKTKRAMDQIKDSRAREEYIKTQRRKAEALRNAGKDYVKKAHSSYSSAEDLKRRQQSAISALQRNDNKNAFNRAKKKLRDIFGSKVTYTKDGMIFKNGLSSTTVTFGEVKVGHPY